MRIANNEPLADIPRQHTIRSLVLQRAFESPSSPFLITPENQRHITRENLACALYALAPHIQNIPAESPIGFFGGNSWASAQILLGAPFHHHPALMFNLAAGDSQLLYMLNHSGCPLVFADPDNIARLQKIAPQCDTPPQIKEVARDDDIGDCTGLQLKDLESLQPALPTEDANTSAALLIYTSGTTGLPKGVLHSHRSFLAGGANTALAHQLSDADRALCVLPLYHINGQCVTIAAPLLSGGSVVLPYKFSTRNFWSLLTAHQCTWFSAVPTIISHLLHGTESPSSSSTLLRFGRSASSALPPETHRQFEKRFGIPIVETMGLTETAAQILSNPPPPQRGKIGSPGVAVGNEVRIVKTNGDTAAVDEEGEIAIRGDNVMKQYWPTGAATTNGWFMSGDLGRMDAEGYVFVTGRLKELIIKGGENISPREIDDALYAAANVVEAAAFAVECDVYGQQVEAAVVVSATDAHSEADLLALCEEHVGKFKMPRRIHFLDTLPKGPSGKIQRLKLAKMLT